MRPSSDLNLLDHIEKVEAPPFLLTRIHQKIRSIENNRVSARVSWSLSLGVALVLIFNIALVISNKQKSENQDKTIVEAMNMAPDNSLYK